MGSSLGCYIEEVQSAQVNSISSFGFEIYPEPSSPTEVEVDEETNRMGEQKEEDNFLVNNPRRDTICRGAAKGETQTESSSALSRGATSSCRGATSAICQEKTKSVLKPIPYQPRIPYPERLSKSDQMKYFGGYIDEETHIQVPEPTFQHEEEEFEVQKKTLLEKWPLMTYEQ